MIPHPTNCYLKRLQLNDPEARWTAEVNRLATAVDEQALYWGAGHSFVCSLHELHF